ncbi:MAG: Tol-Pal system beta propeller repeat protein TolB [Gammaproteobacteria bacterium]
MGNDRIKVSRFNVYRLINSILLLITTACLTSAARAELTIQITEGTEKALPIALVPFGGQDTSIPVDMASIIDADLSRSGLFKTLPRNAMLTRPKVPEEIRFRNWQVLGQDYLVIGQIAGLGGSYNVSLQLFDVYKNEQLLGYRMTVPANDLRKAAHYLSEVIFEKLTGHKGDFTSRIAYLTTTREGRRKKYKLEIADADGFAPKAITQSYEPLMSPAWSPDGKMIAYVSFEQKASAIYVQVLATTQRMRVADFPGINGAPSWSPDGSKLALTLSKDGSPDIYALTLATRSLVKLTQNYAIDTEPVWSPDGKSIVFTSDRGSKPQLYIMPAHGGRAERLTFEGDYNAGAAFSADGKNLAMVHGNKGDYRIAVMDMATRTVNVLTAGPLDESPSFAPNGTMILYAARRGGKSQLSAVSVDGRMRQTLVSDIGEVREPAWSP